MKAWHCKLVIEGNTPRGFDLPPRFAAENAISSFAKVLANSSGWGLDVSNEYGYDAKGWNCRILINGNILNAELPKIAVRKVMNEYGLNILSLEAYWESNYEMDDFEKGLINEDNTLYVTGKFDD